MATIKQTIFTSYDLSNQETLSGSILHSEQKMFIQNLISDIATERVALMPEDPTNPQKYFIEMAYKQGQIAILQHMLDSSIASESVLVATNPDSN